MAAASDLQSAPPALAARFTAVSGVEVVPIFGASGQLTQQIRQGAPYDVFLSANEAYVVATWRKRVTSRPIGLRVRPRAARPHGQ